jgi:hypothetical protein
MMRRRLMARHRVLVPVIEVRVLAPQPADVVELVDTTDSKSVARFECGGSTPSIGIKIFASGRYATAKFA